MCESLTVPEEDPAASSKQNGMRVGPFTRIGKQSKDAPVDASEMCTDLGVKMEQAEMPLLHATKSERWVSEGWY